MLGAWKTRCGIRVKVTDEVVGMWRGCFEIESPSSLDRITVPTWWHPNGDSDDHQLDLMEKLSGPEIFGERKTNDKTT